MMQAIDAWRARHPNLYEFILFNILANIATITNFLVLLLGNTLLFRRFSDTAFALGPFDYSLANGGLCGFLSFLLSYACAQTVNFVVQRKAVFKANNKLGPAIVIYIVAVIIVYFICLYVPTLIVAPLSGIVGGFAPYLANCVNILIQGLTLLGNFGPETPETILADWFDGPIMYTSAAEGDGDLHDGRGDAFCGMLNASYNLGLRNRRVYIPDYPCGTAQEVAEQLRQHLP